jgi:hypothetical protein
VSPRRSAWRTEPRWPRPQSDEEGNRAGGGAARKRAESPRECVRMVVPLAKRMKITSRTAAIVDITRATLRSAGSRV